MLKTCLNHANMETTWLPPMVGTWKPKKSCSLYQWINSISRVCCDGALSIGYHGRTYLVWRTYHSSVGADLGKQAQRAEDNLSGKVRRVNCWTDPSLTLALIPPV